MTDYHIETLSPNYPDEKGETAYWRTGKYLPDKNNKQIFSVQALFPARMSADERNNFYRAYDLKVDQPWFKLDKSSTYIRGIETAKIGCYYQPELLTKQGIYVATISGYPKSGPGKNIPEFQLINTVIVPQVFEGSNNYRMKITGKGLKAGEYHRYFLLVPAGASSMTVKIFPSGDKWCGIYVYIFNPEGVEVEKTSSIDPQTAEPAITSLKAADLLPGVWEIIPYACHNLT